MTRQDGDIHFLGCVVIGLVMPITVGIVVEVVEKAGQAEIDWQSFINAVIEAAPPLIAMYVIAMTLNAAIAILRFAIKSYDSLPARKRKAHDSYEHLDADYDPVELGLTHPNQDGELINYGANNHAD